jgi:hypothetical protein
MITRSLFASLTQDMVGSQDVVILCVHFVRFPVISKLQHDFGHAWVLDPCGKSLCKILNSAIE